MKLSLKQCTSGVLNFIVFLICMFYMLLSWNKAVTYEGWAVEIAIVSVTLLLYQLATMKSIKCNLYSMIPWFTVLNYIFIFGRIYLKALGYERQLGWNLFLMYSHKDAYHAALYCLCYIQGMFTGMVFFRTSKINNAKLVINNFCNNSKQIGIILLIFTLPFRIYCDVVQIIAQRISGGYVAVVEINGVVGAIAQLFPISIIYLIASNNIRDRQEKIIYLSYCVYSLVIMMLSGDRRYALIGMLAVTLCYVRKKEVKINIKRLILFIIVAILGLSLLTAIRRMRETGAGSLKALNEALIISISEDNIFYELFNEFGLTFYTYMLAFKNIPLVIGYKYGLSYVYAVLSVIPGAYRFANSSIMQNNIYQTIYKIENQALGGAFGQELYGNFGLFAPVVAIFAGYLIQKIAGNDDNNIESTLVKYYSLFYFFINLVRASLAEIVRILFYYFIVIWIINKIFKNHRN